MDSNKWKITIFDVCMQKGSSVVHSPSIYIIQFVCLFVRDSRLNYAKNSHQSLGNYRDPPGRTTPRIGVTRPVVSMAFPVYFRYSLRGRPPYFNYGLVAFPVFTRVLLHAAGGVRNIKQ